jgi:C4-dicarboxylate-specific signal transduction histidine kinase
LIVNASHAFKERCDHAGSGKSAKDSVVIEVEDTGAGIPEKNGIGLLSIFFTAKGFSRHQLHGLSRNH